MTQILAMSLHQHNLCTEHHVETTAASSPSKPPQKVKLGMSAGKCHWHNLGWQTPHQGTEKPGNLWSSRLQTPPRGASLPCPLLNSTLNSTLSSSAPEELTQMGFSSFQLLPVAAQISSAARSAWPWTNPCQKINEQTHFIEICVCNVKKKCTILYI